MVGIGVNWGVFIIESGSGDEEAISCLVVVDGCLEVILVFWFFKEF